MSSCCRAKQPCFILAKVSHLKSPLLPSDARVIIFTSVCTITNLEIANSYENRLCSKLETAVLCPALVLGPPRNDPQSWMFLPYVIRARRKGSLEWGPGACCVPTLSIPKQQHSARACCCCWQIAALPRAKGESKGGRQPAKPQPYIRLRVPWICFPEHTGGAEAAQPFEFSF